MSVCLKYLIVISDSRNMEEVSDNSVQMVLTSPPYWNLDVFSKEGEKGWDRDLSRIKDKDKFFYELGKVWKECYRVVEPGGVLVCEWEDYPVGSRIYGYPREICLAGDMVKSIESAGFYLISRWIWKKWKAGAGVSKAEWTNYDNLRDSVPRAVPNWAYIFAFMKKPLVNKSRKLDFVRAEWSEWCDGVWYMETKPGEGDGIEGGAVYPVKLAERLIRIYTKPYDTVLDPFLGTGTTMKACFNTRRSCIGYEVLEKMLPVIKRKVNYGSQTLTGEKVIWEVINKL